MANYLAQRIIDRALKYEAVVARYSSLKTDIDAYLKVHGAEDLIPQ